MKRRTVLGAVLGIIAAVPLTRYGWGWAAAPVARPAPHFTPVSYAAPIGGSGTAKTWQWVALPDSGGLQVYCMAAVTLTSAAVRWTAEGVVTATYVIAGATYTLTVAAPTGPGPGTVTTSGGPPGRGCGLTVRRT